MKVLELFLIIFFILQIPFKNISAEEDPFNHEPTKTETIRNKKVIRKNFTSAFGATLFGPGVTVGIKYDHRLTENLWGAIGLGIPAIYLESRYFFSENSWAPYVTAFGGYPFVGAGIGIHKLCKNHWGFYGELEVVRYVGRDREQGFLSLPIFPFVGFGIQKFF